MKGNRTGFTIVELLVVITIIALLMALIFPVLSSAREAARRALCVTNMQQLTKAATTYATIKGSFPPLMGLPKSGVGANMPKQYGWTFYLLPYVERTDVYDTIIGRNSSATAQPDFVVTIQVYMCPSDPPETAGDITPLSYAANAGMQDVASGNKPPDWRANGVFHNTNNFGQSWTPEKLDLDFLAKGDGARNTFCYLENVNLVSWANATEPDLGVIWQNATTINPGLNRDLPGACDYPHARPSSRHPAGFVVSFCDGHVSFVNEAIDYTVYSRLMTPAGKFTATPGTATGPLQNQAITPTPAEMEAVQ